MKNVKINEIIFSRTYAINNTYSNRSSHNYISFFKLKNNDLMEILISIFYYEKINENSFIPNKNHYYSLNYLY